MATCNVTTLLSSGKDFERLSEHDLLVVQAELLREILGGSPPSVNTLLSNGKDFQGLANEFIEVCQAQLLCEIVGGIA